MPLDTEVGLGQGDTVLDGDSPHPEKGGTGAPTVRPVSIVVKWLDESRCQLVCR